MTTTQKKQSLHRSWNIVSPSSFVMRFFGQKRLEHGSSAEARLLLEILLAEIQAKNGFISHLPPITLSFIQSTHHVSVQGGYHL